MSGSSGGGGPVGSREVAVRCFAAEYDDASLEFSESDEERAPNYVVTPTGARVNRLFVVGVLTEVESVSDDVLRGRVVDPTGAFVVYAGQYQPDAKTALERLEPPTFVAVTGKARTFEPDDGDRVYTSIRPESVNEVDADTRDRWTVQTAEQTVQRVATMAAALEREERGAALTDVLAASGVDPALASGIPRAIAHYGTTPAYLAAVRTMAIQAAEVVAGDRDEVEPLDVAPDEGGPVGDDLAAGVELVAAAGAASSGADSPAGAGGVEPEPASEPPAVEDDEADAAAPTGTEEAETGSEEAETGTAEAAAASTDAPAASTEEAAAEESSGEDVEEEVAATPAASDDDELGDFDVDVGGTVDAGGEEPAADDDVDGTEAEPTDASVADDGPAGAETATDDMYELDEAEVEAVEEEFGTEFSTGNEVDAAGEADIETPGPEDATADGEPVAEEGADDETAAAAAAEEAGDVDLVDAAVAAMEALDEGDGAERRAVVEAVAADHGVDAAAVEEAIGEALMGGRCYEPDDDHLKAI